MNSPRKRKQPVARQGKFTPPRLSDPPTLVEVEWVDAQADIETDGPAHEAGGLAVLPRIGYYVRYVRHGPNGPFVVLAQEWAYAKNGEIHVRDHISIPVGWITKWAVLGIVEQVWPRAAASSTSTSSPEKGSPTTSSREPSAGVSPPPPPSVMSSSSDTPTPSSSSTTPTRTGKQGLTDVP